MGTMCYAVPPRLPRGETSTLSFSEDGCPTMRLLMSDQVATSARTAPRNAIGTRTILPKIPVIMVNFADMAYRTPRSAAEEMFANITTYFSDQSFGEYTPQFDLYGPITLSQSYAYYGAGNPGNKVTDMVTEACQLMDDSLDFSLYDTNNDGKIDLVFVLFAGPPMSDKGGISSTWISDPSNLIWPHYWYYNSGVTLDGKSIYAYEVSSELDGFFSNDSIAVPAGIGLAAHEFGHALGLPDFYPSGGVGTYKTLGEWSLMDYGCYLNNVKTPAGFTAYERWFMNWITPTQLIDSTQVTLAPINTSGESYIICDSGIVHNLNAQNPSPQVCYILENRQQTGWDTYIPGHGLLIYRFNHAKWSQSYVNASQTDMGLDIIEADGITTSAADIQGKQGDAFPYNTITSFTPYPYAPIYDITEEDGNIHFIFRGLPPSAPTGIEDAIMPKLPNIRTILLPSGQIVILRDNKTYTLQGIEL